MARLLRGRGVFNLFIFEVRFLLSASISVVSKIARNNYMLPWAV